MEINRSPVQSDEAGQQFEHLLPVPLSVGDLAVEEVQALERRQLGERLQRLDVPDPVTAEVERLDGGAAGERAQTTGDAVIADLQLGRAREPSHRGRTGQTKRHL